MHTRPIPVSDGPHTPAAPRIAPALTPREIEVLVHWLRVDAKKDVCTALYISIGTMNTHIQRIRDKYDAVGRPATTKAALLARALQDGLLTIDDL